MTVSVEKTAAEQLRAIARQVQRPTHAQSLCMADVREELAIRAAQRLRCSSDDVICIVHVIVDILQSEYGGTHLYVPVAKVAKVDPIAEQVRAAIINDGLTHRQVRRRFGIGYGRLQRILA